MPYYHYLRVVLVAGLSHLLGVSKAWSHLLRSSRRDAYSFSSPRTPTFLEASKPQTDDAMDLHTQDSFSHGALASLAGDFPILISPNESKWSFFEIDKVVTDQKSEEILAVGERSLQALSSIHETNLPPTLVLQCACKANGALDVRLSPIPVEKGLLELMDVMQRIFVQWVASNNPLARCGSKQTISFFQPDSESITVDRISSNAGLDALFDPILDASRLEWVEMVTGRRQSLGQVPRPLVHTFNLLHRGIGLLVTKDEAINPADNILPDLYVHRRCSTKRIFPSLYDMFVGGVSLAEEDPEMTARREVAEELGLQRALEDEHALSSALFDCTVCTAYNRCVVTLFSYTMMSAIETVTWQKEEVDWGTFVPYSVIMAAADAIDRLANKNEWPGSYPAIQSDQKGALLPGHEYEEMAWKEWDFVPDGLLVWEAWLIHSGKARSCQSP